MFGNLSGPTLLVILFIVLLLFGAPKLPALARSLGQSMKILKKEVTGDGDDAARPAEQAQAAPQAQAPVAPQAPVTPQPQAPVAPAPAPAAETAPAPAPAPAAPSAAEPGAAPEGAPKPE